MTEGEPRPATVRPISVRRLLLLLAVLGLTVTGCGHSSSHDEAAPADAQVAGALVVIGGPCCHAPWHVAGTIHVHGPVVTTMRTDDHGRFSIRLPAGRYRFSATSGSMDDGRDTCTAPHPVSLEGHRTRHVRVICDIP